MIYLDNAATTFQKPPQVYAAVAEAFSTMTSPGRGGYGAAMAAADALYRCRKLAGQLFDAEAEQVAFTMNATHGLNIAIKTLVEPGDTVVVSGFEHNAVMRPLHGLGARIRVAGRRLFDHDALLRDFDESITPEVRAVVCTHVSNVFGWRLPVEEIAQLCVQRGVPLIVDASQSAGVLPVSLREWQAAFVAMPGHKGLYGPQGTGLLLCGRSPRPLMEGGTGSQSRLYSMPEEMPDRAEAGTHNVPGICGLAAGLQFLHDTGVDAVLRHEQQLCGQLAAGLGAMERLQAYTGRDQVGVLSVVFRDWDCEEAARILADGGIAVRAGLHCAPLAHESAGTLECGTVRFSVSAFTTQAHIRQTLAVLEDFPQDANTKILPL